MKKIRTWFVGLLPIFLLACTTGQQPSASQNPRVNPQPVAPLTTRLRTYTQEDELKQYLRDAKSRVRLPEAYVENGPSNASPTEADSGGQGVTNNQEAGADEGGLVKNYGNYLIILRQGKLFSVLAKYIEGTSGPTVDPLPVPHQMDEVAVKAEGLDDAVWYDELLMLGNKAIVIGYRYSLPNSYWHGVSEINVFTIGADGQITRDGAYFIESGDYYSGRNYASRLVDRDLVLYTPYYGNLLLTDQNDLKFPKLFSWANGSLQEVRTLLTAADVSVPEDTINSPTLHILHVCSFENGFTCKSKGVLGGWRAEHYVTDQRFYLWVDREEFNYGWCGTELLPASAESTVDADRLPPKATSNLLYAFDIHGDGAGVTKVSGSPLDQFSFSESTQGLDLFSYKYNDANRQTGEGPYPSIYYLPHYQLARLPFSRFANTSSEVVAGDYHGLTGDFFATDSYSIINRFTDKELVLGHDNKILIVKRDTQATTSLEIPAHQRMGMVQISRIEKAGNRVAVIGQDPYMMPVDGPSALFIQLLNLSGTPTLGDNLLVEGFQEGETRSHGYVYADRATGDDLIGLATQEMVMAGDVMAVSSTDSSSEASSPSESHWGYSSSSVHVVRVTSQGELNLSGHFSSHLSDRSECTTSCVDWYGNTRPVFLGDSVFGLMGDQLSLGSLDQEGDLTIQREIHLN